MSADREIPFLTCTNCGQKSTDTRRCKHCGRLFGATSQPASHASSPRAWRPAAAVITVVAIAAVGYWRWTEAPAVTETDVAPVLTPDTTTIVAPAETAVAAPAAVAPAPAPKEPPKPAPVDTVLAVVPAQPEPAPERKAQPVAIDPERQRYAKTWANVRSERSSTAQVVQVLDRGEVVAIDSLVDGWYRVTTDRPTVGYVDQQFLDTLPPSAP